VLIDPETKEKLSSEELAKQLKMMVLTPGWVILESYILRQADKCSQIDSIQTHNVDNNGIAFSVRVQQSKRDAYRGIVAYVRNTISKGGRNGERRTGSDPS